MQLPADAIDHVLAHWPVARLATTGGGGVALVPIVFAAVGGRLWTPIDGKPKGGGELARVRHVRAHPDVSLLLDHYGDDWSALWWLRIGGTAEVVTPDPADPERDPAVAGPVAALRRKYPQYEAIPVLREPATLIAIRPNSFRSWCAGPDALAALA